jgi:hypothetical protein
MRVAKIRRVKAHLLLIPLISAKERGPMGYSLVSACKPNPIEIFKVSSPWASEVPAPILATRSGPTLGSCEEIPSSSFHFQDVIRVGSIRRTDGK